jgi:cyclic pyranopterin phosphate synthase
MKKKKDSFRNFFTKKMTTPAEHSSNHFDASGRARMVDVSQKNDTAREAKASAKICMSENAFNMVKSGSLKKGDVLGVARLAGIMAAKQVDRLIPLAHPLNLTRAEIEFSLDDRANSVEIIATIGITGKTGVEMEALTAVSIAALTIYDMAKSVDKAMTIQDIKLLRKSGGKSGIFERK